MTTHIHHKLPAFSKRVKLAPSNTQSRDAVQGFSGPARSLPSSAVSELRPRVRRANTAPHKNPYAFRGPTVPDGGTQAGKGNIPAPAGNRLRRRLKSHPAR